MISNNEYAKASRDFSGSPHSDYDGTHVSRDVRSRGNQVLNAKAGQDPTGDGWRDFNLIKPSQGYPK